MRRTLLAVGLTILSTWTPASAQDLNTREREAQSARAADRTVRQDLLSIFKPVGPVDSGMFVRLRGVGLDTPSFGTTFPDLCQRDIATVWYAPVAQGGEPRDTPLRPYSITASHEFRFVRPPPREVDLPTEEPDTFNGGCQSADDNEGANWFGAENDYVAIQGALVFLAAIEAVRQGALPFDPCADFFDKNECKADILAAGNVEALNSVEACEADDHALCFVIEAGGMMRFSITAQERADTLTPGVITSMKVSEFIIVT